LPFTLFDANLPLYLRLQSIPLAVVSFTLAALFQNALNHLRYGFAAFAQANAQIASYQQAGVNAATQSSADKQALIQQCQRLRKKYQ